MFKNWAELSNFFVEKIGFFEENECYISQLIKLLQKRLKLMALNIIPGCEFDVFSKNWSET